MKSSNTHSNSIVGKRIRPLDIFLRGLIYFSAILTVMILVGMIIYIVYRGASSISWNFLSTPAFSYPYENYGILANIINTLYIVVITLLIATPIGVGAAIYLSEYAKQGKLVRLIEFTTETLAGIPSIIYGLFGSVFFYTFLKTSYSILAGALTMSIMILPTIIRTTQESLKTVPLAYREGAMGIGATKWYMIRTIILPSSIEGILTSIILAIGRIVGESAALIFTAGIMSDMPEISSILDIFKHTSQPGATLTVQLYQYAMRGGSEMKYAFSTALVLLVVVLFINIAAKLIGKIFKRGH